MKDIVETNFAIGQVVRHKHLDFRGVIFDVDPEFNNTEEWSCCKARGCCHDQPVDDITTAMAHTGTLVGGLAPWAWCSGECCRCGVGGETSPANGARFGGEAGHFARSSAQCSCFGTSAQPG